MENIDLKKAAHVYFIGIGGVSMSGLAKILLKKGFTISGSDMNRSNLTAGLEDMGVVINYNQVACNITKDIDYIVYTAAIHENHKEYARAKELGIPLINRAVLLGKIMEDFKRAIAISGTHGKTTTTAMLSHILLEAKLDPTVSIGGVLDIIGGNILIGGNEIFLTEACEYTNSFLDMSPNIEVILNVEADHLDFFKDIDDIRASFKKFIDKLDKNGTLVINSSIKDYDKLVEDFKGKLIRVGENNADIIAKDIVFDERGFVSFSYTAFSKDMGRISLLTTGEHNVYNALAAIGVALDLGIDAESIRKGLGSFVGAKRRFEHKGRLIGDIDIIDDYAHHPQEIEASLKAARKYPNKRVVVVFQPHTYTRTKALLSEFAKALSLADIIVLAKIYPARETDDLGISSLDIVRLIEKEGKEVYYIDNFNDIETFLLEKLCPQDMCITMGAGDIVKVGENLLGK